MSENYLAHHGRLGQKWGKKNGPPYPLDFSKLSSEEKENAKRDSIAKGDVKTAYANKSHYSNQEIDELIKRFDIESKLGQKVADLNKKELEKGKAHINKVIDTLGTINKIAGSAGNIADNVKKIRGLFEAESNNNSGNKKQNNNSNSNNKTNNDNKQKKKEKNKKKSTKEDSSLIQALKNINASDTRFYG